MFQIRKMSSEEVLKLVTCTAPVNIAVIKYWGKRNETLILPVNDSISVTLSSNQMNAKTTVTASPSFTEDKIWLNRELQIKSGRLSLCLEEVRANARMIANPPVNPEWKVHVCSENNFPTAAGLASSAAGYACLVTALCKLYNITGDTSVLARRGSGSACRSVYGGFVHWQMGVREDGRDSIAVQLAPSSHWPELRVLICVASDSRKKTSSSVGMKNSVETSPLLKFRAEHCVPKRTREMIQAIQDKNFPVFAELTMKDSNQFHAVCQDTYPPCVYLNQASHAVSSLVHQINSSSHNLVAAYTFDAGPNACIFLLEKDVPHFLALFRYYFSDGASEFIRGETAVESKLEDSEIASLSMDKIPGGLKYVLVTKVGDGPELLGEDDHLMDQNGEPLFCSK
ncbi:diphosphomevalonate decarboxylase [Eurytemora carolleeae]|uniref:diphosphomevalonate decarboxylase n=1 Tax=Eurytemora carolleeae TaxID=1294199 RepID=UPI000C78BAFD|nr:diphosphomevalonate decarboxylase [Eurytemora carolleeae]|eukprot:XP_023335976.1 diphosphomevalonate decarboxylase-like [Eurytemora affinis]